MRIEILDAAQEDLIEGFRFYEINALDIPAALRKFGYHFRPKISCPFWGRAHCGLEGPQPVEGQEAREKNQQCFACGLAPCQGEAS